MRGFEILPFNMFYQRLKGSAYLSVGKSFEDIKGRVETENAKATEGALFESINPVLPSVSVNITHANSVQVEKPETNFWKQNAPILTAVGIVIVAIVVVLIIGLSNQISTSAQVSTQFKTDLAAFYDEAQKLIIMTGQGVD
jgi:hypothetical protein